MPDHGQFILRYSHNIIEHLGLKLYQNKPTNVIAELISNSWDADAINVWVNIDNDSVYVIDDGIGMTEDELKNNYLVIGKRKRDTQELTKRTSLQRYLMGRKGIGKLAPFGIAHKLQLMTVSSKDHKLFWIELDLDQMLRSSSDSDLQPVAYEPTIIYDGVSINDISEDEKTNELRIFLDKISKNKSGTAILMKDLSLKRMIPINELKYSLGQRFTVTLLKNDFTVFVNEKELTQEDALPKFAFRIPEQDWQEDIININNKSRKIRYWVGFVDKADWAQDHAGVGVYAHGKIAQDRPFTFGLKGREIWSRYMYGVIEADWLDELEDDVVSTDRTSVNWEHEDTHDMYEKGRELTAQWIKKFQKYQKDNMVSRVEEKINNLPTDLRITEIERKSISSIVCSMSPRIQKDDQLQDEVVQKLTSAWIHRPSRKIIQDLWGKVKEFEGEERDFINTLNELYEHLVPESLSLSVVVSQKIYALTRLNQLTSNGSEQQLQALLEKFPWILGADKDKVVANSQLKNLAQEAAKNGLMPVHGSTKEELSKLPDNTLRPDFTFFSDANDKTFIVVELKNPQIPLQYKHVTQLNTYFYWLKEQYPEANVKGYLIGQNPGNGIVVTDPSITVKTWKEICLESRKDYVELLASMLGSVSEYYDDTRIKDAIEFGGKESIDLLRRISQSNVVLQDLFEHMDKKLKYEDK